MSKKSWSKTKLTLYVKNKRAPYDVGTTPATWFRHLCWLDDKYESREPHNELGWTFINDNWPYSISDYNVTKMRLLNTSFLRTPLLYK